MLISYRWRCVLALVTLSCVASSSRAVAQAVETSASEPAKAAEQAEPPQGRYKDEITVIEKTEKTLTVPSLEKASKELGTVAGGAGVVDAESYARGRASTLKDALEFVPGVFVQPRFGSDEARLSIRGSGLQRTFHGRGLKLLQDGVPLNLADGGFDFQAVDPLAARYIEVLRGANALEHGSSTLGGAINYVSRSGHDANPFQVRTEAGSFGYLHGQVSSGFTHGALDGYVTLTHAAQDGYREHSEQSNQRLFGNFGLRVRDDLETRFYVAAFKSDSELPGSLTKAQLEADPSLAAAGNVALDQKRDYDLFRIANRTSLILDDTSRLDLSGFWARKNLDHPIFQVLVQDSDDVGFEARYETTADLWGRSNRLVAGVSPVVGVVDDNRFRNVAGRRGAPTAAGKTTSTNFDVYAEDRHEVRPRLYVSLGAQASYARRDFDDDFFVDGDQTDLQTFQGVSPKLGVFFEVTPATSIYANLSRSFEPPSFGELANLGGSGLLVLDAQTATTLEAGSRGRSGWLSWDTGLYYARISDELLSLNDAQGNPLGTINAGRTLHTGAEVGLEARAGLSWGSVVVRQVYNWSHFVFVNDPTFQDNTLAGIPEHFFRTDLLVERGRFYAGPNLEWVPSRYPVDHANTLFADPYLIAGAKVGYRGERGIAVFVEGRNLTDKTYAATTGVIADARGRDSAQFLPGDGRSVFAGLEYRW